MSSDSHIETIILAGANDFGRCPIASHLPTALWPVLGEPVLRRSLVHLASQGIRHVTICSNEEDSLLKKAADVDNIRTVEIGFTDEPLPVGTAGSLRDAVSSNTGDLLVVLPVGIVRTPDMDLLVTAHRSQKADLTVVFNPSPQNDGTKGEAAGIYVCNPSVLKYIPAEGYYDIKEGLIPELLRAGARVRCAVLPHSVDNFRDCKGYLCVTGNYLMSAAETDINLKVCERNDRSVIWKGDDVVIEPRARIYGRVVLLDGARVEADAVIFGPAILGRDVNVGRDTVIVNSILWDGARAGRNCEIQRCLVDYNVVVPDNSVAENDCIAYDSKNSSKGGVAREPESGKQESASGLLNQMRRRKRKVMPWLAGGIASIAFLWSYWPGLLDLWNIWQRSDEYSSGLLVPFLAGYILWSRRRQIAEVQIRPCLWGVLAFVAAQAVRFLGLFYMYGSAEKLSVVLSIVALALLLFGWEFFRKVSTIMLFLLLMLPWPNRVQGAVAMPLQRWATSSAVFCLEVLGYEATSEGNIIHIGQVSVAIAEACNGLRMVTAFFVISGLVVLLVNRPWWEKVVVFVSSLPIALFCNTIRLTLTAIAFTMLEGEHWERIFHDFGGYAMMPLALVIVVGELWFLAKLVPSPQPEKIHIVRKTAGLMADNKG